MPATTSTSPRAAALRRGVSIALSAVTVALCATVLAVQVFLPDVTSDGADGPSTALRFFERSARFWALPPIVALLLVVGLPRRDDLNALPAVLGWTALALLALCLTLPALSAGIVVPSWLR